MDGLIPLAISDEANIVGTQLGTTENLQLKRDRPYLEMFM